MNLPELNTIRKQSSTVIDFKGYNHNLTINEGEFYDMKNMCGKNYPVLCPRNPRGTVRSLIKPNGLYSGEKLAWVDGTEFWYGDAKICDVADIPKQFVSLGAYIIIFPDKIYYNTSDGKTGSLEASYAAAGAVTYESTWLTESELDAKGQAYTKIKATGIHSNFKKHDGVTIEGSVVTALNKTTVIQDIGTDFIVIVGLVDKTTSQMGGLKVKRTMPEMDYFTSSDNRIWGCSSKNHEIYACKLGDPFNWNCFESLSTDSYAVTVGSVGDFTGACTYLGYVMFFKEDIIHKVYGSKPANYQIMNVSVRGVEKGCEKSVCIMNEMLYYKARNSIVAFPGSVPDNISQALGEEKYMEAVGGWQESNYYLSMKDNKGQWCLFVLDGNKGLWHKEDNTHVLYFASLKGELHYIDADDKKIKNVTGKDAEVVDWFAEFGLFTGNIPEKKYISRINISIELEKNSYAEVWVQYNSSGEWKRLKTIKGIKRRSYNIPIIPYRCEHFQLKLCGTGMCRIYGLTKQLQTGGDL